MIEVRVRERNSFDWPTKPLRKLQNRPCGPADVRIYQGAPLFVFNQETIEHAASGKSAKILSLPEDFHYGSLNNENGSAAARKVRGVVVVRAAEREAVVEQHAAIGNVQ